jgi:hypothetical protein
MRFKEITETTAMDRIEATMKKNFSPEQKAADKQVLDAARNAEMGKGDADAIKNLIKQEQAKVDADPDLKYTAGRNVDMLKRALAKTGSEQELKITSRMGNKVKAGDGVEIDLDKVDVDIDPATKKPKIKPKGSTPGNVDPKDAIKPGQTVELS